MKVLIVGGAAQGKLDYAKERYPGMEIVIPALHETVRRLMEEKSDPRGAVSDLLDSREDWIVICDEVGCGVVPADAFARDYRESVGRLCCKLAAEADVVLRITCGVAQKLKGETNA